MPVNFEMWELAIAQSSKRLVKLDPRRARSILARFRKKLERVRKNYEQDTGPTRDAKLKSAADEVLKQGLAQIDKAIEAAEKRQKKP